jgi:glycine cleavage system H protein
MTIPEGLWYSSDHEWLAVEGSTARVGITDYAQDALGDVVYVQAPSTGVAVRMGDTLGEVESTKSVSDIYAPVSGTISAVNEMLSAQPELLNTDPYGAGWICEIELADPGEIDNLLDAGGYRLLLEG